MTMQKLIDTGWFVIMLAALFTCVYVSIDEGFIKGKAYMFLLLSLLSAYFYGYKKLLSKNKK